MNHGGTIGVGKNKGAKRRQMSKKSIRDLDTGKFLCREDYWSTDARLAIHFEDQESAMIQLKRFVVRNADLVSLGDYGNIVSGAPLLISN